MFRSLNIYKVYSVLLIMKILKEKSREYKGQNYYKYKVNIPEVELMKASLKVGDNLEIGAKEGILILKRKKEGI